ncbi:MAG TPA: neprosin family prolyl endopeptidase [Actinoplanes sp.]|nr:neprosin family prolyl endopeptidase [Actinoplanes sp.]
MPPPAPAEAPAGPGAPPEVLPWGAEPEAVDKGVAGATSSSLAASGADIAPADVTGPHVAEPEFSPKGFTSKRRTREESVTTVPPVPPGGVRTEPVPGTSEVRYHYSTAYQYAESDGTYANLVIGKPRLDDKDYHSLAEIAVQSDDGRQIVEVGWTVDRGVNGDEDPHLFVYHWVDGQESCYNGCGFRQYSSTVVPGDTLPTGVAKRFAIQQFNGAWWIAYDTEWVGYFPGYLWDGGFTRSGLIQWFGEVAASSLRPCTEMGTGADALDLAAARAGSIALINGPEPAISVRAISPGLYWPVYTAERLSLRTFRYGGPGVC